jgi:hypothetical protein
VVGIGSTVAVYVGRLGCAAFVAAGGSHLLPPPPPPIQEEMHAMFLFLVAMVPLATGEIIAGYLNLISITAKIKDRRARRKELETLQRSMFGALIAAGSAVKKLFAQTAGMTRGR